MMPRLRLLAGFGVAGIPFLITPLEPAATPVGVCLTLLLAAVAVLDLFWTERWTAIEVTREHAQILSVGARNPVKVTLRNTGKSPAVVTVHDEAPAPGRIIDLPNTLTVPPGRRLQFIYHCEPHHMGANQFGTLFLRKPSRFGLWTLQSNRPLVKPVKIYPDIQSVRQVELLARQNRLAEAGVRLTRLRGRGSDFDRLREYRREDEYRNIDWKATARHQALISREYVVERNQNLLLVLDSGRSMCNTVAGVSHFDRALNATMLLTYVALRQGDTVGLLAGDRIVRRWVKPVRGRGGVERLVGQVYDLQPHPDASDYDLLANELRKRYQKRSLIVWMTHAIDDLHLQALARSLSRLRSTHLVLVAFLRNVELEKRSQMLPTNDLDAFQIAAAAGMIEAQREQFALLERSGLLAINCLPEELSSRLISRYLDIKARHLL